MIFFLFGIFAASPAFAILGGQRVEFNDKLARSVIRLVHPSNRAVFCTGVMLTHKVVLTAAHCLKNSRDEMAAVLDPYTGFGPTYEIERMIPHPQYARGIVETPDLALIILKKEINFANPLELAPEAAFSASVFQNGVFIAGFGVPDVASIDRAGKDSGFPLKVISKSSLKTSSLLGPNFFEIDQSDKQGMCFGDSGGPGLVMLQEQLYVLGINKATKMVIKDNPQDIRNCFTVSSMTSISPYRHWIMKTIELYK